MKKSKFCIFLIISLLIIFSAVNCGGGSGSGGGTAPAPAPAPAPNTPSPTPTLSPSNKGVLITITAPDAPPYSLYAVIACPTDYPGNDNDLTYTANDGIDLKDSLIGSAFWAGATVSWQNNIQVTHDMIQNAVSSAAANTANNGLFLFFYSGHGTNISTTAYLIPYDGINDASKRISQDDLRAWLNQFPTTTKKYVLIDACNSGYFIDKGLKGIYMKPKLVQVEGFNPNYRGSIAKSITGSSNTYVMTASRGDQLSWEIGGNIQNGIFSYYLVQGLGSGATIGPADANSSSTITAEELTVYVPPRVSAYVLANVTPADQNPQSYDNVAGDLRVK